MRVQFPPRTVVGASFLKMREAISFLVTGAAKTVGDVDVLSRVAANAGVEFDRPALSYSCSTVMAGVFIQSQRREIFWSVI